MGAILHSAHFYILQGTIFGKLVSVSVGRSHRISLHIVGDTLCQHALRRLITALGAIITESQAADTSPEGPVGTARGPCPASSRANRHMVVAEAVDGGDDADEEAKEDIEAVVAVVEPARGRDEDGDAEGHEGDSEEIHGRRSGLATNRLDIGVVASVAIGHLGSYAGVVVSAIKTSDTSVDARGESSMETRICGAGTRNDERNSHDELASEVQREVDESCGGGACVAAGVASEAVPELMLVLLGAYVGRVQLAVGARDVEAADDVLFCVFEVGHAAGQHVGSRLAAHVLDAANEEEGGADGHEEAEPGDV